MRLKGFFAELNFSERAAIRAIDAHLEQELYKAWDAWLTEFIRIVPVWSGMSVGSVLPLADIIGRSITINAPQGSARRSRSSAGANSSSATLQGGRGKWTITYETAVQHLIINEYFDARVWGFNLRKPGPYNFQPACAEKFMEVASQATLPDLSRFFDYDKRSF